jgi:hypothetical protein
MGVNELRTRLAEAIENIAAIEKEVGDLSSSVAAMRLALQEVSPEKFEPAYAKHYEGAICEQVRRRSSDAERALLEIARRLKLSD